MTITFTTFSNTEWKDKIDFELNSILEQKTQRNGIKSQYINAFFETHHIGGVVFEVHGDTLWIDALWVDNKFRRQGVGRQILDQITAFAGSNQIRSVQLNTYFLEAKDFFRACDFQEVASIPEWKYGLTCYLMKRDFA